MKGKIVHIEIPSGNTEQATQFWGKLAGWSFKNYAEGQEEAPEYHMFEGVSPAARSTRATMIAGSGSTSRPTTSTLSWTGSVSSAARPKRRCRSRAWAGSPTKDPNGNEFSVWQSDESAPMPEGMGAQSASA